ncbi:MAG: glycosyltransferase family 2 protein [Saprospiraceae bacterium]|nr:glycosyltransferase family 2 protein [Saprospiraceae bacterium]MCF8251424.1 glycosyltransferase family 2 protein [Saprospiraceae bacterium]MCF8312698.1 glycosyltransferase family 2 protein [Saprospiraceae bacterium]MCF8441036.1 glycosyltransferase family 2 protein [Saprospiraceae bacterium]
MKPILVSIIIPCYNVEDYVAECLDSAINQTYRPIEIIAVDNNSTDGTLAILKDYEKKYPDLITVLEEKKQGPSAARNKGMTVARGEWLQFLDADDLLLPEKIKLQVDLLCNRKNAIFVIGVAYFLQTEAGKNVKILLEINGNPFIDFAFTNIGTTNSNFFNHDVVMQAGCWDESLTNAEDVDLFFRMVSINGFNGLVYDTDFNTIYRQRLAGQITSRNYSVLQSNSIKVRHRHYTYLQKEQPELFSQNKPLFQDMLYYPIYCLGIYDIELSNKYRLEYLGKHYIPSHRPNIISRHHVLGVRILGFPAYMRLRWCVKIIFSFFWLKNLSSGFRFKKLRSKEVELSKSGS